MLTNEGDHDLAAILYLLTIAVYNNDVVRDGVQRGGSGALRVLDSM